MKHYFPVEILRHIRSYGPDEEILSFCYDVKEIFPDIETGDSLCVSTVPTEEDGEVNMDFRWGSAEFNGKNYWPMTYNLNLASRIINLNLWGLETLYITLKKKS